MKMQAFHVSFWGHCWLASLLCISTVTGRVSRKCYKIGNKSPQHRWQRRRWLRRPAYLDQLLRISGAEWLSVTPWSSHDGPAHSPSILVLCSPPYLTPGLSQLVAAPSWVTLSPEWWTAQISSPQSIIVSHTLWLTPLRLFCFHLKCLLYRSGRLKFASLSYLCLPAIRTPIVLEAMWFSLREGSRVKIAQTKAQDIINEHKGKEVSWRTIHQNMNSSYCWVLIFFCDSVYFSNAFLSQTMTQKKNDTCCEWE